MRRNQRQTATVPHFSVTLPDNPLPIKTTHNMPPWKLSVSDSKIKSILLSNAFLEICNNCCVYWRFPFPEKLENICFGEVTETLFLRGNKDR